MRRNLYSLCRWACALLVCAAVAGCSRSASGNDTGSWRAASVNGALSYWVDSERDVLVVVRDGDLSNTVAEVQVGRAPERVIVGPDDSVYISNRGGRSVSLVRPGKWTEAARVEVGVEPVGMAISEDNATLYVVNGSSLEDPDQGTLTAVDLRTLTVRWELPLGEEPRGIELISGKRASITSKHGEVWIVDLADPQIIQAQRLADGTPSTAG
jgi:DNA-binding beta-propeller fold protein YncE